MKLSILFGLFLCVFNLAVASTFVELTGDSIEGYMNDNGNVRLFLNRVFQGPP